MASESKRFTLVSVVDETDALLADVSHLQCAARFLIDCLHSPGTAGDPWEQFMSEPSPYSTALPGVELLALVFREYDTRVQAAALRIRELAGER